jgi:hypothetical protein
MEEQEKFPGLFTCAEWLCDGLHMTGSAQRDFHAELHRQFAAKNGRRVTMEEIILDWNIKSPKDLW